MFKNINYDDLCRFRSFILSLTQLCSAWILVFISIDRWIRTRLPFKAIYLCTPKKALFVVAIFLIVDIAINSHILTSLFGTFLPGLISLSCGAMPTYNWNYTIFFYLTWPIIQVSIINIEINRRTLKKRLAEIFMSTILKFLFHQKSRNFYF